MTSPCDSPKGNPKGTFSGSRSLKLFYQSWYPQSAHCRLDCNGQLDGEGSGVKGVLAIVHGLGEHSGRYCQVVEGLTKAGYAVFGFDNQGHGKSEGQRGHIDRWQDYRNNTQAFLEVVRRQEPNAPLFLMGHSLGGLIVLDYVLRSTSSRQFKSLNLEGLILSVPLIQPAGGTVHNLRVIMARLLSGLFPRFTVNMGLEKEALSRDKVVTDTIAQDPLTHPYVTLRWGTETLDTIRWVKSHIDHLQLPVLLVHGEADPITKPAGTQTIFQKIQSADKTLKLYPDTYHEPHNDLNADTVVTDFINWLDSRTVSAPMNA